MTAICICPSVSSVENDRVESVSGLTFVARTLTQNQQILVGSAALEYSVEHITGLERFGGLGLHGGRNVDEDGV